MRGYERVTHPHEGYELSIDYGRFAVNERFVLMDYPRVTIRQEEVIAIVLGFESIELRLKFLEWHLKNGVCSKSAHLYSLTAGYVQVFVYSGNYSRGDAAAISAWVKTIPPLVK